MTVEVEKKYPLSEEARESLLEGAELVSETKRTDVYYDTPDYALLRRNVFLRRRNGSWELKVGQPGSGEDGVWQYDELEDEAAIRQELALGDEEVFEDALIAADLAEFVSIGTRRRKYRLGDFTIDVDRTTYPAGDTYEMVEVELLTDDPETGKKLLLQFEDTHGLPPTEIRGKIQEYCHRHDPERWQVYEDTGLAVA